MWRRYRRLRSFVFPFISPLFLFPYQNSQEKPEMSPSCCASHHRIQQRALAARLRAHHRNDAVSPIGRPREAGRFGRARRGTLVEVGVGVNYLQSVGRRHLVSVSWGFACVERERERGEGREQSRKFFFPSSPASEREKKSGLASTTFRTPLFRRSISFSNAHPLPWFCFFLFLQNKKCSSSSRPPGALLSSSSLRTGGLTSQRWVVEREQSCVHRCRLFDGGERCGRRLVVSPRAPFTCAFFASSCRLELLYRPCATY